MLPAIAPGDWLLVDPTTRDWPRRGSVVVIREPNSGELAIKRVAAGPGDRVPFADGYLILAEDEAWLLADADEESARDAGFGEPIEFATLRACAPGPADRSGVVPLRATASPRPDPAPVVAKYSPPNLESTPRRPNRRGFRPTISVGGYLATESGGLAVRTAQGCDLQSPGLVFGH